MLPLAADENLDNDIIRGLLRRNPAIDIVRVQDAGLSGADDPERGERMPGLFEVPQWLPVSRAIEDLLLLAECSRLDEWEGQIRYLPL